MKKENKQLLLKDLCARLPYKVNCKVKYIINNETTDGEDVDAECTDVITRVDIKDESVYTEWLEEYTSVDYIMPYLRPLISMTEEEKQELFQLMGNGNDIQRMDFYNSHLLDIRRLIEKGLALPASVENGFVYDFDFGLVKMRFHIGDKVKRAGDYLTYIIKDISDECYKMVAVTEVGHEGQIDFSRVYYQDQWQFVGHISEPDGPES